MCVSGFSGKWLLNFLLTILLLPFLFVGSAAAEGMAYRENPVKLTVLVDGFDRGAVDMALTLQPGEIFRVELLSASGTGYAWNLSGEPRLVKATPVTAALPVDNGLCGGSLRETYIMAAGDKPGTETICFAFARPWETGIPAAKTLTISVTVQASK